MNKALNIKVIYSKVLDRRTGKNLHATVHSMENLQMDPDEIDHRLYQNRILK